jgi:hypothetical protein
MTVRCPELEVPEFKGQSERTQRGDRELPESYCHYIMPVKMENGWSEKQRYARKESPIFVRSWHAPLFDRN